MRTRSSVGRRLAALVPVLVATSVLAAPAAHAARPADGGGGVKGHTWDAYSVDTPARSGHTWDRIPPHPVP